MDDQNPDSTSEPFEAYPYRIMFVAARMIMRLTTFFGLGPLPVHLWQLNAPWVDAVSQLEDGLELFQLRSVREQQLLEGER